MIWLILALATALRLFLLGSVPVGLYIDEAAIGVDARAIAETGKDIHGNSMWNAIYPSYGDYKLPVYVLLAGASVKLLGFSEFAVRLPSAIAGIATVALVYGIAQELFIDHQRKKFIATASALAVAIMPWSLQFSRAGFEGHVGQALVLLAFSILMKSKTRPWLVLICAAVGAAAVYTYYSVRFVFPVVFVLGFCVLIFQEKKRQRFFRQSMVWIVLAFGLWMLALVPMIHHPLYRESQMLRLSAKSVMQNQAQYVQVTNLARAAMGNSMISRVVFHRYWEFARALGVNIVAHLNPAYLFFTGDQNLRHGTRMVGLMLPATLPFFLVGLYVLARKYQRIGLVFGVWYLVALLPASVPMEVPHALRSLNGLGVLGMILGLGSVELIAWLWKQKILVGVLLILVIMNFSLYLHDYYTHYPQRSAAAWSDGLKSMAKEVAKVRGQVGQVFVAGDPRQVLYIILYGDYPDIRHIQKIPSTHYLKSAIDNVIFRDSVQEISQLQGNDVLVRYNTTLANDGLTSDTFAQGERYTVIFGGKQ